jgi:uncharacterized membrane protein
MRIREDMVWHELFEFGVALKALNAAWETLGGILFFTVGPRWLAFLEGRSRLAHEYIHPLTHSTDVFVSIYLLAHGLINGFLAYNLFRNRLWAYPVAIGFTLLVLIYEVYRLAHTHSLILLVFTLFDPIFIALTWHEWHRQSRRSGRLPD